MFDFLFAFFFPDLGKSVISRHETRLQNASANVVKRERKIQTEKEVLVYVLVEQSW